MTEPKPTEAELREARDMIPDSLWDLHSSACHILAHTIASALAAARSPAPEWRPIDQAPKDGTMLLLAMGPFAKRDPIIKPPTNEILVGSWRKAHHRDESRERWRPYHSGIDDQEFLFPTHFMPLPSPPKETT